MSGDALAIGQLAASVVDRARAAMDDFYEMEAVMRDNPEFEAWVEDARAVDIAEEARARGLGLRGTVEMVGPCPDCGGSDRFAINTRKQVFNCRGCGESGDVIALTRLIDKSDFRAACEHLTGKPAPDGKAGTVDQKAALQAAADRAAKAAQREAEHNTWREGERRRAYEIWCGGAPVAGSETADYLAARGLGDVLPLLATRRLRHVNGLDYWHQRSVPGQKKPKPFVLHHGPAMLAPITDPDGRFAGVHMTWFLPMTPGRKVDLVDPQDGDDLPAKKIRGSKRRGAIRLIEPDSFDRLVIGEGIETVLSVACAEIGTSDFARTAYWSSIDLQHLGGKAVETIAHPDLKTTTGRPQRVPGPLPDMGDPKALPIPDHVVDVLQLGDGDSDRFTAEQVHARSARRWARPGRRIRTAWAPESGDFNDVWRGVA